jgi:Flp pilus assembly protein TadG
MFKTIKTHLQRFTACTNGNISMMLGLSAIPVFVASGAAIDFGRYTNTHHDVAMALDAGMLAAAAKLYNDDNVTAAESDAAIAIGKLYFKEALGTQNGASIGDPVMVYDADAQTIKATVSGDVYTSFMAVAGFTDMDVYVTAETKVGYEELIGSDVEVSMMLDVTGSMCNYVDGNFEQPCTSSDSMNALKTASKDLIQEVLWDDQSTYKSKVAIVPFSSRVRLAPDGGANSLFTAVTGMPATWSGHTYATTSSWVNEPLYTNEDDCEDQNDHRWRSKKCQKKVFTTTYTEHTNLKAKPCVTERYLQSSSSLGLTEDAPGLNRYNNGNDGSRRPIYTDSSNTAVSPNGSSQGSALAGIPDNYSADGVCDDGSINNANTLVPLTSNKTILNAKIDGLVAENGTAGVLGTSFAWYAISPDWATIWGADSAPQSYAKTTELNEAGKPKLFKIAVLMTDGEYNRAIAAGNPSTSILNTKALELCSAMKAKNIEVYTVGFKLPSASAAKTMLASCATDASHFKDASSSEDLKAAFKEIGKRIKSQAAMEIRLTQ